MITMGYDYGKKDEWWVDTRNYTLNYPLYNLSILTTTFQGLPKNIGNLSSEA